MKRHRFDPFSFLFGALFVTVGATFLFGSTRVGDVHPARLWPAALAVVGATLVFMAAARLARPVNAHSPIAVDDTAGEEEVLPLGEVPTASSDDIPEPEVTEADEPP